ncbi:hypothetical protein PABG_11851 [Paracoccidioides brasiliensis Pb03]|nr:hypothetical protein PABG_11851 [Paracoccidioides brasiliensis Pb03]ODH52031.1 hypothetical protein GX48_01819 [Paracoccidioides brasiliensis]
MLKQQFKRMAAGPKICQGTNRRRKRKLKPGITTTSLAYQLKTLTNPFPEWFVLSLLFPLCAPSTGATCGKGVIPPGTFPWGGGQSEEQVQRDGVQNARDSFWNVY